MKILKIFGIAVAVHATVFMFVFATPGCRSTTRQSSHGSSHEQPTSAPSASYPAPAGGGSPSSAPSSGAPLVSGSDLNPGVSSSGEFGASGGSSSVHFNPTRPGTSVANALQTGPVADVVAASTYTVAKGDTLSSVAKKHGVSMGELVAANNLKKEAVLRLGQKLIIPAKHAATTAAAGPTSPSSLGGGDTLTYEVKAGENLGTIAKHAGTTVSAIRKLNHLTTDQVRPGQKLTLPAGGATSTAAAASTPVEGEGVPAVAKPATAASAPGTKYTIKAGESLGQIAKKFNVHLNDIAVANNISDPKKIRPGQELIIPANAGKGTPGRANTTAPTTAQRTTSAANTPVSSPEPTSPVGPAPAEPTNPISAPPAGDTPPPPVIKVDEGSPVAPVKS